MTTDKLTYAELRRRLSYCPALNSTWRHYKSGAKYMVLGTAIDEASQEPIVLYIALGDPDSCNMARPLREWEEVVSHEGRQVARFTKVTS